MSNSPIDMMPFSKMMGIEAKEVGAERIVGELTIRPELCTTGKIMHGGAVMAFADALGAIGAFLNLPKGSGGTTTIESKTNFLGAAPEGVTVVGTTTPVKIGARLSVWKTEINTKDGKPVALVVQTQMVL